MRFANAPKPLEGAATLVFPNSEEAGVVDAAVFLNGLDWTCADLCIGEPFASSASGDILVSHQSGLPCTQNYVDSLRHLNPSS